MKSIKAKIVAGLLVLLVGSQAQANDLYLRTEVGAAGGLRLFDTRFSVGYALSPALEIEGALAWSAGQEADFIQLQFGPRILLGNGFHNHVISAKLVVGFNQPLLDEHRKHGFNHMSGMPVFLDIIIAGYEMHSRFGLTLSASLRGSQFRFWMLVPKHSQLLTQRCHLQCKNHILIGKRSFLFGIRLMPT